MRMAVIPAPASALAQSQAEHIEVWSPPQDVYSRARHWVNKCEYATLVCMLSSAQARCNDSDWCAPVSRSAEFVGRVPGTGDAVLQGCMVSQ